MSVKNLIIASVATRSVFKKYAKLSDEEKKDVIEKVKSKMNVKDDEDSGDEDKKDEEESTEEPSEEENKEDDDKDTGFGEEPAESEDDDSEEEDDNSEEDDDSEEGDDDSEEEDDSDNNEEELPGEPVEEPAEEPVEEQEGVLPEVTEDKKGEIEGIVNELVEEVKTIKNDGQVQTKDVLGLIMNMMEMVNLLVQAKAPMKKRKSKKGAVEREFLVASKVAASFGA